MSMIGQYELRGLIGEGGIGQVQAAFDTVLEREVAIKSLRPELLNDKTFFDRFRSEATSLARLNHPNITTLYQLLPEGQNLFMVMELVRGDTVDGILKKRNGPLGIQEALAITAQAADGLSYAHSMGVIHRDIKPANLMVTDSGLLKIMDFGIARMRGSQRMTRDGNMVGTLAYMSPEQLRGEPGDERSDLYSLAIVLYEILSGRTPFEAASDYDLMQAQINARPERLLHRVPGLDAKVDAALMRALAKKPEDRFASVRAFSDALGATALRIDASKIVLDATRLMSSPAMSGTILASPPGTFDRLAATGDRLVPWLPESVRMPALVGVSTLLVTGAAFAAFFALMPSPVPTRAATPAAGPVIASNAPQLTSTPAAPQAATRSINPPIPAAPAAPQATTRSLAGALTPPPAPAARVTPQPTPEATAAAVAGIPAEVEAKATAGANPKVALATAGLPTETVVVPASPAVGVQTPSDLPTDRARAAATPEAKAKLADAFSRKAYAEAFELAAPLAESGDRQAQSGVAWLYGHGEGVARDDEKAAQWYRKAAEQGDVVAQFNLGAFYEAGRGVEQSYEQAFKWYQKAAELGDADAQNQVAIMCALGMGTKRDDIEAVTWFSKAAQQGLAKAQKNLGEMYASGRGIERDEREALKLYRQAAEQKHPDAEYLIGAWYESGKGGLKRDYSLAAQWYARAADHGSTKAQEALDQLRRRGRIKE